MRVLSKRYRYSPSSRRRSTRSGATSARTGSAACAYRDGRDLALCDPSQFQALAGAGAVRSRSLRPREVAERQRFAYLAFGGGPRICIGNRFALAEAQIILATWRSATGCGSRRAADRTRDPARQGRHLVTLQPRRAGAPRPTLREG